MRKRTTNSKDSGASRPSTGGQKTSRRSNDGTGRPFTKTRPEAESRFSKPSIKKSSLRVASGDAGNTGQKGRPNFDHEKGPGASERPRFDKFGSGGDKPRTDRPRFPKKEGDFRGGAKREFGPRDDSRGNAERPRFDGPRPEGARSERPRFEKRHTDRPAGSGERSFRPREEFGQRERPAGDREFKPRFETPAREGDRPARENDRPARDHDRRDARPSGERSFDRTDRPAREGDRREARLASDRPFNRPERSDKPAFKKKDDSARLDREGFQGHANPENADQAADRSGLERRVGRFESAPRYNLAGYEKKGAPKKKEKEKEESDLIRLNRYIANAGICSRREADDLIAAGEISVNGKTVTEMGYKVMPKDVIKYGKKALSREKMVYILINKPKDYITTTDDPEERKTVLDLIQGACSERVYPVGRLDRNTTGLLLLTNDGELAEKLTHPSGGIKKIYQAELDKPITTEDFEKLQHGLELEDGFIHPDEVGIVTPDAMVVGLEIHSGRNRIVRRMFEHLGYEVQKLDRTVFAGLNKKDLPRGKWRFLSEKEVVRLKFML